MERFKSVFDAIADSPEEAADLKFRSSLMLSLRGFFEAHEMGQKQIGELLGEPQSRVSELMTGKITKFSSDKLIRFMKLAGYELKPKFVAQTAKRAAHMECEVEEVCEA
ncbi:XRE family transcriptional regulator [Luteimonas fraxinea]|uniref:XRE family transcriptional regulator n=1 Tax=Luteimonas fraxinea TaxID=2901869 RepID=A0ABS8UG91_9GAMM|nr:XRE family transcriptional regulator [Luteimonas fraxinea]MCD9098069.1 XRE family transcriptional regulator [Luteimonas fraxinea]UHH09206.1 XRE family transcriptional regulator [Luteimonas fraxinea]